MPVCQCPLSGFGLASTRVSRRSLKLAREVRGRLCTRTAPEVESRPARRDEREHCVDPGATGAVALLFLPALVTVEDRVVPVGHHPLRIDAHASNSIAQRGP